MAHKILNPTSKFGCITLKEFREKIWDSYWDQDIRKWGRMSGKIILRNLAVSWWEVTHGVFVFLEALAIATLRG
jgi:hypothetical protein